MYEVYHDFADYCGNFLYRTALFPVRLSTVRGCVLDGAYVYCKAEVSGQSRVEGSLAVDQRDRKMRKANRIHIVGRSNAHPIEGVEMFDEVWTPLSCMDNTFEPTVVVDLHSATDESVVRILSDENKSTRMYYVSPSLYERIGGELGLNVSVFPFVEVVVATRSKEFTSTIAWMVGLAILQYEPTEVWIHRVDLNTVEYINQLPAIKRQIGYAEAYGFRFVFEKGSNLSVDDHPYMYE